MQDAAAFKINIYTFTLKSLQIQLSKGQLWYTYESTASMHKAVFGKDVLSWVPQEKEGGGKKKEEKGCHLPQQKGATAWELLRAQRALGRT